MTESSEQFCPCCKTKTKKKIRTHNYDTGQPLWQPKVWLVMNQLGVVSVFESKEGAEDLVRYYDGAKERYWIREWELRP